MQIQNRFNEDCLQDIVGECSIENVFTIRNTKPTRGNKYYTRIASGGWNDAIQGKPLDKDCDVLSNCVGYANGRFAEISNEITGNEGIQYQLICNAENFIEAAKEYGLEITDRPTLGGIMVWKKGTLDGKDGVGHVAIVEKIIDNNTIYTSESNYGSFAFANIVRQNKYGNWGLDNSYDFIGCIINPVLH